MALFQGWRVWHRRRHLLRRAALNGVRTACRWFSGAEQVGNGELNRRVNRLARYLRKRGVNPNTPVGLRLQRSVEIVVALLGALQAGGVYVTLDPPTGRNAWRCEHHR